MNLRDGFAGFDVARSVEDFDRVKRIRVKWGERGIACFWVAGKGEKEESCRERKGVGCP